MTISAPIRPRHRYLTSVDHGWGGTARDACHGLRPRGPKSSILVNGFTAWTLYWGATSRWSGELALIHGSVVRALFTAAVLAGGVLLAGCNSDEISLASNAKANQPVPPKLISDLGEKDMDLQSPMLVRLFKQEAELEVWKQTRSGQYALLKTYPICRWSGDLGPKVREGDRQAPEGFYAITPGQMNPQSAYYLSFNIGYPNAFDKALGRTGSQLMVHGDCSSRGCYAMTDEQIAEIYSLGREAFFGGQRAFQVQAYPFRMTPQNLAKHRNNPNIAFWRMLKQGSDHFELSRLEPKVNVCEKRYVSNAHTPGDSSRPPTRRSSQTCRQLRRPRLPPIRPRRSRPPTPRSRSRNRRTPPCSAACSRSRRSPPTSPARWTVCAASWACSRRPNPRRPSRL